MKVLIRFNKEDNSFVDFQTVNSEYKHIYQEVDEFEEKEGFNVVYKYHKDENKVIGEYVEIPKTEIEILKEQITANSKALEDMILGLQG